MSRHYVGLKERTFEKTMLNGEVRRTLCVSYFDYCKRTSTCRRYFREYMYEHYDDVMMLVDIMDAFETALEEGYGKSGNVEVRVINYNGYFEVICHYYLETEETEETEEIEETKETEETEETEAINVECLAVDDEIICNCLKYVVKGLMPNKDNGSMNIFVSRNGTSEWITDVYVAIRVKKYKSIVIDAEEVKVGDVIKYKYRYGVVKDKTANCILLDDRRKIVYCERSVFLKKEVNK